MGFFNTDVIIFIVKYQIYFVYNFLLIKEVDLHLEFRAILHIYVYTYILVKHFLKGKMLGPQCKYSFKK